MITPIINNLMVDKLKHEAAVSQSIVECFYNEPCKQKIINLDLKADESKIAEIAYAYGLQQFMVKYPDKYKHASSQAKAHVDSILKLTQ